MASDMGGVGGFGGRWLCLSAAIVATFAGTGVGYAWGVFSPSLKSTLQLSQTQLMIVANAPTYCVSLPPMAFIPGWVYDWGGDRRGAAISMVVAALGLGGGYMLMYATAEHLLPMPTALEKMHIHPSSWSVALLSIGNVAAGYGASFSTVACMCVIVKNFPHRRGTIVGIVKCITGLSGGMYAQIYTGFLAPRTLSFVLMAALSNLVLNFGMAFFLPVVPADQHEKNLDLRLSLAMAMVILLTMGILASACAAHFYPQTNDHYMGSWSGSSADEDGSVGDKTRARDFAIGIMVVFAGLLFVPAVDCDCLSSSRKNNAKLKSTEGDKSSLAEGLLEEASPSDGKTGSVAVQPQESTPCQALKTLDCWLLMWADSWAQASGMLISTNLGQLVEASGANGSAFFVSIFSVGNCMGRALIGLSSDALVRRGVPRSAGLLCVSITFTLMGLFGTHISSTWLVTVVVILGGLGMGAINGLEPAIVSEMFGLANMGANYMLLWAGQFGTVVLLSQWLSAKVYEAHITKAGSNICTGPACFEFTFVVVAAVNASGMVSAAWLMLRQWRQGLRSTLSSSESSVQ